MTEPEIASAPIDRQRALFRKLQIRKWSNDTVKTVPNLIAAYQTYAGFLHAAREGQIVGTAAKAAATEAVTGGHGKSFENIARRVVQELFACRCSLTKQTRQIKSTQESIEDGGVSAMSVNEIRDVLQSDFAHEFLRCPGVAEAVGPLHSILLDPAAQPCETTRPATVMADEQAGEPNQFQGWRKRKRENDEPQAMDWQLDVTSAETKLATKPQMLEPTETPVLPKQEQDPGIRQQLWKMPVAPQAVAKLPRSRALEMIARIARKRAAAAVPADMTALRQRKHRWESSQQLCAQRARPYSDRLRQQLAERMAKLDMAREQAARLAARTAPGGELKNYRLRMQRNPFADAKSPVRQQSGAAPKLRHSRHPQRTSSGTGGLHHVCQSCRTRYAARPRQSSLPAGVSQLCRFCRHRRQGEGSPRPSLPSEQAASLNLNLQNSEDADIIRSITPPDLQKRPPGPSVLSVLSRIRIAKKRLPSPRALRTALAKLFRAAKDPLSASMAKAAVLHAQMRRLLSSIGTPAGIKAGVGFSLPKPARSRKSSSREQKRGSKYAANDPRLFFGHYY